MKTLVAGWFSFELMGASAGDLMARDLVCRWLVEAGQDFDVAAAPPFRGGVRWEETAAGSYGRVIFVCGPFGNGEPVNRFLEHFAGCELIGINLSMLEPIEMWNPFDLLLERDSSAASRPDVTMLSEKALVPVVGLVLIDEQPEYGNDDLRGAANEAFDRLIASREMSVVRIDTRLDVNAAGLRTPSEVESLIARMDVVLTTRLHGLVLGIKNGVPAIAIDSVAGGHKVSRQAETLGWPYVFRADGLDEEALRLAFDACLRQETRTNAARCRERALITLAQTRERLMRNLA